jgi:hypothetical protein
VFRLRRDALDWLEAGDEVIALDHRSASYLSSNATGSALWKLLVAGATRDDLVEQLLARFEVTRDRAAGDVDSFLGQLERAGLLVAA